MKEKKTQQKTFYVSKARTGTGNAAVARRRIKGPGAARAGVRVMVVRVMMGHRVA